MALIVTYMKGTCGDDEYAAVADSRNPETSCWRLPAARYRRNPEAAVKLAHLLASAEKMYNLLDEVLSLFHRDELNKATLARWLIRAQKVRCEAEGRDPADAYPEQQVLALVSKAA